MKRLAFISVLVLAPLLCEASPPPFHLPDHAAEGNDQEMANRIATHRHDNDGSARLRDVLPETDSLHDLGASGREWEKLYVDTVTFTTEILPKTDSTGRIGKSGQEVATIHVDTITVTTAAIGMWKYSGTQVHNGASSTSFTDLDLSAVVGANRAIVLLKVTGNLDNVACRENGDTTDYFSTSGFSSANRGHSVTGTGSQIWCNTDSAGVIEWRVQTTNTATIDVIGYIR